MEGSRGAAAGGSGPSGSPFAEVISSLAVLHQEQHRALLQLREDQDVRFQAVLLAQQEDRESFRSWVHREVRTGPRADLVLQKMGPQDDPEAFLGLFERVAVARGWLDDQWALHLIPLLSGEAQVAAQQLPPENLLVYAELKKAILQRVGRSPEEYRQRFRSLGLAETGRPYLLAQQLRDSCRKWLMAGDSDVAGIVDKVVLEQFTTCLPQRTAAWVQCHRPTSLDSAIQLAEDHLVACPGIGEILPAVSLPTPATRPIPAPRTRPPIPLRGGPRGRGSYATGPTVGGGTLAGRSAALETGSHPYTMPYIPPASSSSRQLASPLPAIGVAGRPGPACWRCGDPDHFIDRCPVMDVGTMIRVPVEPRAAPGPAGLYQIPVSIGGVHTRLWWIQVVTRPPSTKAWFVSGHGVKAARLRCGVFTGMW
ncbi:putative SCAN domain-containing protein SCAND2P [Triplophysa rosa]|uniref:SCAN domain-containing protein SCAND2P n=1 Tax=Triplophysa rosa TaxID=992332 RepID=A0A9W7TXU3_TRIRA|nr:putative SCAN domain-containing protein SCAND2P [Triplophysa rosa]